MQFGICTSVANSAAVKAAGWDFVEENVQSLLQGELPDDQWHCPAQAAAPVLAANCLVPAALKITGPDADLQKLHVYLTRVMARAAKVGIRTLVFGSGGARNVPDGWDRATAQRQIVDFARMASDLARRNGILLVAEHLNRRECNILNTLAEAEGVVHQVNQTSFQNLVDSYHFWLEKEKLEDLANATPFIRHVHVADVEGRVAPGESGTSDYRPFFRVLKQGGYNGPISVEAIGFNDIAGVGPRVLAFLKEQWNQA
jgi:sugar phosphate isomerase/epimerase